MPPRSTDSSHNMLSADPNAMSVHHLEEISSGCGDRISLSIRWNNTRLIVHLDPSPKGDKIEDSLIRQYNEACVAEDFDKEEDMSDRILDVVVETGKSTFDQLAPPPALGISDSSDLHCLLFPKEYSFRFRTQDNRPELVLRDAQSDGTSQDTEPQNGSSPGPSEHLFHLTISEDTKLTRFSTQDIVVLKKLVGDGYIAQVMVEGQVLCSKVGDEIRVNSVQRELDMLFKIGSFQYAAILRVPRLRGLVQTPDGRVIGFLEEYIPSLDNSELSSLRDIEDASSIAHVRRQKWALQVQETVDLLHQIGVTWGDGKASNVLINSDSDDAWIVDFGGGWTDGWVEPELSGTVEGDKLAVKKILEFLEVG